MANEFDIDPKNKLGEIVNWGEEDDSDFMDFVRALDGQPDALARLRALQGEDRCGGEVALDPISLSELGAAIKRYR